MKTKPCVISLVGATFMLPAASRTANLFWANTGTDFNAAGSFTNATGANQAPTSSDYVYFPAVAVTQPTLTADLTLQGFAFRRDPTAEVNVAEPPDCCGYTLSASNGAKLTLTYNGNNYPIVCRTRGTNFVAAPIIFHNANNRRFWA